MEDKIRYIQEKIAELKILITEEQAMQLYQYYKILVEKNKVMNLTGITEFEEVVQKHFVDSLSLVWIEKMDSVDKLIDVGTGAGFPGIPLKIVYPHLQVTLLDSLNKRVLFLQEVVEICKLSGVETVHGRAEDIAKDAKYREKYDICVSRAVANLAVLSEYCLPFVKIKGSFVAYKSGDVKLEVEGAKRAIELLGGKIEKEQEFVLPGSDIGRCLVKIEKKKVCAKKYPRKEGVVSKAPL